MVNANAEVREVTEDALAKLYATLKEDDMFYGLWRRRAKYAETISALSFEQLGLWDKAQQLYETAQIKARVVLYHMVNQSTLFGKITGFFVPRNYNIGIFLQISQDMKVFQIFFWNVVGELLIGIMIERL